MEKVTTNSWAVEHRPKRLEDMVGQETSVRLVKGFIKSGKIPSSILITGKTGSGKTTLARIIANLINGYSSDAPNPDTVEINIGDEGGVNDIRNMTRNSRFRPERNFKVYILDEAHLITKAASGALLKPLEEPSPHVVWILCTDQPDKLLPTIIGRCLSIKLKALSPEEVVPLLKRVVKKEKTSLGKKEDAILLKIAETCGAQPRSSLQLLQSTCLLIESGEKPSEAINQAIETLDSYQIDKVIIKSLIGVYTGEPEIVVSALGDTQDYPAFINQALEMHKYLLDLHGSSKTYHSYSRKQLLDYLKKKLGSSPSLINCLKVHNALTEIKLSASTYGVREDHLLLSRLGNLSHSMRKSKNA